MPLNLTDEKQKYLSLLSKEYPTLQSVASEIINLQALLKLPKPTEHFMSDLHGEHEAFTHILSNASGVIKEKVDRALEGKLDKAKRAEFATLIYYPNEKLNFFKATEPDLNAWYHQTLLNLIAVCRMVASKYTRSFVRKKLPESFAYTIDELLHAHFEDHDKEAYFSRILSAIIDAEAADSFIIAMADLIKQIAVFKLHIVGDIFDRGPRPDIILDKLLAHHSVDVQWGNHDVLWMGAAAGSAICVASVIHTALSYNNLPSLEEGYGINLRPLALFAEEVYKHTDVSCFMPKLVTDEHFSARDMMRTARMHKAIAMILFKLECAVIQRNPSFDMAGHALLKQIDFKTKTVLVSGVRYPLIDSDFPTVDASAPDHLTGSEQGLIDNLCQSFVKSERLQRHAHFLYAKGSIYHIENGNLLFHGAIPLTEDGEIDTIRFEGQAFKGRAWMDYCQAMARMGYYAKDDTSREKGRDFLWYLWCGKYSPVFGRAKMSIFENIFISDKQAAKETKNPYYAYIENEDPAIAKATALKLFAEFGLLESHGHIINGHIPVRAGKGETPLKAGGRIIIIDGGFCKAYHTKTGIAGYTLVYSSRGLSLRSHSPFESTQKAVRDNVDILSTVNIVENSAVRLLVEDTDAGREMKERIADLEALRTVYTLDGSPNWSELK